MATFSDRRPNFHARLHLFAHCQKSSQAKPSCLRITPNCQVVSANAQPIQKVTVKKNKLPRVRSPSQTPSVTYVADSQNNPNCQVVSANAQPIHRFPAYDHRAKLRPSPTLLIHRSTQANSNNPNCQVVSANAQPIHQVTVKKTSIPAYDHRAKLRPSPTLLIHSLPYPARRAQWKTWQIAWTRTLSVSWKYCINIFWTKFPLHFKAQNINDEVLLELTDDKIAKLNLSIGYETMLYQEIAKLKKAQFGESSSAQTPSAITTQTSSESGTNQSAINGGPEPTSKWVYQALEEDTSFAQSVLYPILNKKLVPNNNQINLMVRILGKKATNIYGFYPTTETKHQIALDIIDQFQQLSQTAKPGGPPESAFFYHNNGKGPGKAHKGKIFKFFGNGTVTLPADKKKFPRSAKTVHNIDDDIIKANEKCAKRAANKDNFEIQDAFARLNQDTYDKYNNVKKLFAMGNLTNLTTFDDVEDGALRGCLNIMNRLDFRGIKRKYTEEESIVQTLARPLIRWVK
ncbi:hypothetical protein pipiens_016030, partial [Culex pipiens pipiens]